MGDFLKKFSNKEYNDFEKHELSNKENIDGSHENHGEGAKPIVKKKETNSYIKVKNEIGKDLKEKDENIFQISDTKEESYVKDDEKIKKRKVKITIGLLCTILIFVCTFFVYRQINRVNVPSFALEKNLSDVQVWAAKNKIDLDYTSEFSIKADDGFIISQSVKSGSSIQKGDTFKVIVSKGADPEEVLSLPDFSQMNILEIEKWKNENKANNLTIEKKFSDEVESGKFLSQAFKTDGVEAKTYKRKDKVVVTISKGKETFEKDIEVVDFKGKMKTDVDMWAREKEVVVEYNEVGDSKVEKGGVISQEIAPKTKIAKNEVFKVVISKGKVAFVPNFIGLDEARSNAEATKANIQIMLVQYYSNSIPTGTLISQSITPGTEISEETVVLIFSSGKPYIGNFDGQDLYEMVSAINEMNAKGATLTYEVVETSSGEARGTIITSSSKADFVNTGSYIVITVSRGQ